MFELTINPDLELHLYRSMFPKHYRPLALALKLGSGNEFEVRNPCSNFSEKIQN